MKVLLWIIAIVSFIATIFLSHEYIYFKKNIYKNEKIRLEKLSKNAVLDIESILEKTMNIANKLANKISRGEIPKVKIRQALSKMIKSNENIYGGAITFAPFSYDKDKRLYSVYYSKSGQNGELEYLQLSDIYDYTTPEYDWYVEPMKKGNQWSEPYWDDAGKTFMVTYSAVFYKKESKTGKEYPNGVVTVDISMVQMKNIIESLDLGNGGFGTLTTKKGNYIYHPNYDYVRLHKNIKEIATENNDKIMLEVINNINKNENGVVDYINQATQQDAWLFYEPMTIDWSLQTTFFLDDLSLNITFLRHKLIQIITSTILFLFLFLTLFLLRDRAFTQRRAWNSSLIISLTLLLGIGLIWNLALFFDSSKEEQGIRVWNHTTLNQIMNDINQKHTEKFLDPPIYIPTGIYIESIDIIDHKVLSIVGRLWQKYPKKTIDNQIIGFHFADATEFSNTKIDSRIIGDYKIINWNFKAHLNLNLNLSKYPLEINKLKIKIEPNQIEQSVVLIPNLESYKLRIATQLPGISKNLSLDGWKLTETVCTFNKIERMVNFGIKRNFDQETLPSLNFEISIKRMFINAFISNLTPLIISLLILFSMLFLPLSINISTILSISVSVFFVVVLSHLSIRENLKINEMFYLEYFFFIVYLIIMLIPINAFRNLLHVHSDFFEYKNGLFPKILFWPTVLIIFYIVTALVFY